eukprot:4697169-Lingulodinium_polyedra.AAC.1
MEKQQSCIYDDVPLVKNLSRDARSHAQARSSGRDTDFPAGKGPTESFGCREFGASVGFAKL